MGTIIFESISTRKTTTQIQNRKSDAIRMWPRRNQTAKKKYERIYSSLKTSSPQARNRSSDYHMMTTGSVERCQTLVLAAEMVNETA